MLSFARPSVLLIFLDVTEKAHGSDGCESKAWSGGVVDRSMAHGFQYVHVLKTGAGEGPEPCVLVQAGFSVSSPVKKSGSFTVTRCSPCAKAAIEGA